MLLEAEMEKCVLMDRKTKPDGYGGVISAWVDGAEFMASIIINDSIEAKIGEKLGVTGLYTVYTNKNVDLDYHAVFYRVSDGQVFRVTSRNKQTPDTAALDIRMVSAEEWEIPR